MFRPIDLYISRLRDLGCRPKQRGAEWYARCPVHGGKDYDSLSMREGSDARVLLTCHSHACSFRDITEKLDLKVRDAFEPDETRSGGPPVATSKIDVNEPDATYDYVDRDGVLQFQVMRFTIASGKTFRQRRPTADGGWEWNLEGVVKIPYRLQALLKAIEAGQPVFIVEGEKDVDALAEIGVTATTFPGGAIRDARKVEPYASYFKSARVYVIPDNDDAGEAHAEAVRAAISQVARVSTVALPGIPHKGDTWDWLNTGGTKEQLFEVVNAATKRITVVDAIEFANMDLPPKEILLGPWLCTQDVSMVHAWRGVGKTHFAMAVACAVATGGRFLDWKAPAAVPVLYVDGEMPGAAMQERALNTLMMVKPDGGLYQNLHIVTPDIQSQPLRSLASAEGRLDMQEVIEDIPNLALVVLDNLSCLHGDVDENEAYTWNEMQTYLLQLRTSGVSTLLVHHTGKSGGQRGTSKREDILDVVIRLAHPPDYEDREGARFMVQFEKARGLYGEETMSFEAHLTEVDGVRAWVMKDKLHSEADIIAAFIEDGMSQAECGRELGKSKATVSRIIKRAKEAGLWAGPTNPK
jgi:hypothetical protein